MSESPICISALMCHAPIVIPLIAEERARDCRATTEAMGQVARRVVARDPGTLVVISPHTPRAARAFGLLGGERGLSGDFARFGVEGVEVDLPGAPKALESLYAHARERSLSCVRLPEYELDHGASVPLWFLRQAGWRKETLVIALPEVSDHTTRQKFGELLGWVARKSCECGERPWAIIASGDMSHRLTPGAPAGFHPRAAEFDRLVSTGVREGRYRDAVAIEEGLRGVAAEDVVESLEVACAATGFQNEGAKFFSYEGPFGVGYMEAVLFDRRPIAEATP